MTDRTAPQQHGAGPIKETICCIECKTDTGVVPLSAGELSLFVSMPPTQSMYEKDYFCCRECEQAYGARHNQYFPVLNKKEETVHIHARYCEWDGRFNRWKRTQGKKNKNKKSLVDDSENEE